MTARTLLCFGDSNTHGTLAMTRQGERRRHAVEDRWTSVLGAALGESWHVVPEGQPGRTSVFDDPVEGAYKNGYRALPMLLESHRPIDLVVILLGTNDCKARFGIAAPDIALGVQRLALLLQGSDCGRDGAAPAILVAAPLCIQETGILADMFSGGAAKSRALPGRLRDIAARNDLDFIDLNAFATVDPTDGIHLDTDAHAAIGAAFARHVAGMSAIHN